MSVALVTGTSAGIGLETALTLSRRGVTTYASMRNTAKAGELRERAAAEGLTAEVIALDVNDNASVTAAVRSIEDRHGAVDILVNNAGNHHTGPIEALPLEQAESIIDTNLMGPVRTTRAVLPAMRARGNGVIANIGSIWGRLPSAPQTAFYNASKAGLSAITESLAWEVGHLGIRVLHLAPEVFSTDIAHRQSPEHAEPYTADARWVDHFRQVSSQGAPSPAVAAESIVEAVLGPGTPLHQYIGPGSSKPLFDIAAAAAGSYERWAESALPLFESIAGPRPVPSSGEDDPHQ
jgi:NAD(P)-dependent dehydrogenase (short-subunit alcohol dehydrogenase family)